jgi:excisionase family DNA binding protein
MSKTEGSAVACEPPRAFTNPLPRLAYGINDAADTLDLSRSRIYELIAGGEICACKVGKRTIIPAAELTAFLDRHRVARPSGRTLASTAASPVPSPQGAQFKRGRLQSE